MSGWDAVLGGVASLVGLLLAIHTKYENARRRKSSLFAKVRQELKDKRSDLTDDARAFYVARQGCLEQYGLLVGDGWIPSQPLPIAEVALSIDELSPGNYTTTLSAADYLLPHDDAGVQHKTYSSAVQAVLDAEAKISGQPRPIFENRESYRLMEVRARPFALKIGRGMYFDHQNTGEVVGYETALVRWRRNHHPLSSLFDWRKHRLRTVLGDPTDLLRRCVVPGVSTLTIRKGKGDTRFFMHEREHVSLAQGTQHVTPAGEFQPSGASAHLFKAELDLWKNIQREYNEEFLGAVESWHSGRSPDYVNQEPHKSFNQAYERGDLAIWFLGIGLDPLTLKAEILTCAIWEEKAFDQIFGQIVDRNDEGVLCIGEDRKGIKLTAERLRAFLRGERTLAAGRACIALFLRHREMLNVEFAE